MKRAVSLIMSLVLLLPLFPQIVHAEEAEIISEKVSMECGLADRLVISDKTYYPVQDGTLSVTLDITEVSYTYNTVYLNGTKLGNIVEGKNTFTFNMSDLQSGDNELRVVLGTTTGYFNESLVYGKYNLDDLLINSVAFSGLGTETPKSIKKYMPIQGAAGTTITEDEYTDSIRLGDGYSNETGLGGSLPNTPISVGFVFEKNEVGTFNIDTTVFADGEYEAIFYKENSPYETKTYIIDNTAPEIEFSVGNGSAISPLDSVTYTVKDASPVTTKLYVDGTEVDKINPSTLERGSHTAYVIATDAVGRETHKVLVFDITDKLYSVTVNDKQASIVTQNGAVVYGGTPITDIYMYENPLGDYDSVLYKDSNESLVSFDKKGEIVTTSIGNRVPYHSFVVDTSEATGDKVVVSYSGETEIGSGILLKAWNYKENCWDVVARTGLDGNATIEAKLDVYSKDGEMKVIATPDIVYNGSDSIFWNSDTQYYTRYEDLNDTYYAVTNYAVELYNKGEIGYCVHTGDLVDQAHAGDKIARKEFAVADAAQAILDNAKVPNGVVSGNHDVMHANANYSYYEEYFGEDRYKDFDWYGGSLNNNMHHFDLVSIGAYDFVFMYIGTYKEAEEDTIAWANAVCEAYPNRNVVICTHEYIKPSGQLSSDRAQVIWDEIIVPNENVVMVLCGHNPGICDQITQVGDSDRYILEVLADYQYVDLGNEGNGVTYDLGYCCLDGEGFVRLMTFNENGQVATSTYSPVADMNGFYPAHQEKFVYDLEMITAKRSICTKSFNVLTEIEEKGSITRGDMDVSDSDAFYLVLDDKSLSEVFVLNEYTSDYITSDRRTYETSETEIVGAVGHEFISENLKPGVSGAIGNISSKVTVGLDLLKTTSGSYTRTSGTTHYTTTINSDKSVTVKHQWGDNQENWITQANYFSSGKSVNLNTYNRLYFSVTASKSAIWDIVVNFSDTSLDFAGDSRILKLFGDVNNANDKMCGTWSGYIDLSSIITGTKTVTSIYIVSSVPEQTVTFDYLFLGKSSEGKVRFIVDENTIAAKEAGVGTVINVPEAPYKKGYYFDGWYNSAGQKVTNVTVTSGVTNITAKFVAKKSANVDLSNDANYIPTVYKNSLWVTHFNSYSEGVGAIFTEAYSGTQWGINIAFKPTGILGTYEITQISNGLSNGSGQALDIPSGGFVYVLNRGNNYPALYAMDPVTYSWCAGYPDYTSVACNNAIAAATTWKVGDKMTIGGVSIANEIVPTETPEIAWYYDDYTCTATYELNKKIEGDENYDGIPDSYGATVDSSGRYTFDNAYGYEFNVDAVDGAAKETTIIVTNANAYADSNPNWAVSVLLAPTKHSNEYKVVKVVNNPGSAENANMTFGNGNIVIVAHSGARMPYVENSDGTITKYPNWMSRVAAAALTEGDTLIIPSDYSTATVCAVDYNGHDYEEIVTKPTCSEEGYTTYTCYCGHTYVDNYVSAAGHTEGEWVIVKHATAEENGLKESHCTICGKVAKSAEIVFSTTLRFSGAALTLQDDLMIKFKANANLFEADGFNNPYAIFVFNGKESIVSEFSVSGAKYNFAFSNINPSQMNDLISVTLYATKDGVEYCSETREYSVATYAYYQLGTTTNAKFRTLLVDLLNYGAASQNAVGYKTDNLVNAALTEEQKAWGTSEMRELVSVQNLKYEVIDNPTVNWKGGTLVLGESIKMRFKIDATDLEGMSVKVTSAVGEWEILSKDFKPTTDGYYVYFSGLNAGQLSESVYVTVCVDGVAVSNTLRYSVESYAAEEYNGTNSLAELVRAMMKYGDAAKALVE